MVLPASSDADAKVPTLANVSTEMADSALRAGTGGPEIRPEVTGKTILPISRGMVAPRRKIEEIERCFEHE